MLSPYSDFVILFEDNENYVHILDPNQSYKIDIHEELYAIAQIWAKKMPQVGQFLVSRKSLIPSDLTFRDAWRLNDQKQPIRIDFDLALSIHRNRLKVAAMRLISDLNAIYDKAIQSQNLPVQIATKKTIQILQTIHEANMSHCKTVEDIKAFVPQELKAYWPGSVVCCESSLSSS